MNLRELSQLVTLGEGQHLEFKKRVPSPERIAKEVIAFANTGGGRLLLGIDDDGSVVGVKDAAEEEYALQEALSKHSRQFMTSLTFHVSRLAEMGLYVCPPLKRLLVRTIMNLRELSQLVTLGEGQHLEFKKRVPSPERIAKEVIAFANTGGGRLLLGIDDDGSVVGVKDAAEEEYALQEALSKHSRPPVVMKSERIPITKKRNVIVVRVPVSEHKPHYLINGQHGARTAYVRIEDMSVEASREAVRLMRAKQNPKDVFFEFRDKEQILMRYLDHYGRISVAQFASLAGIPSKAASQTLVLLTRAKVLQHHADPREDYFTLDYRFPEK